MTTEMSRRSLLGALGIGGLAMAAGVPASAQTRAVAGVYIGSYTSWGTPAGPGLQVGTADSVTGKLTITSTVSGVVDPSWFAYSLDKRFLFTTNESVAGRVSSFNIGNPARPVAVNSQPTKGSGTTHLSLHPSGRYLLASNYSDGKVSVLPVSGDGRIGAVTDVVTHTATNGQAHAHQTLTDPSGRWIVSVDLGADSVYVYRLDLATGKLQLNQQLRLPAGLGPRHLAFHPNGQVAYILGELRSQVTVAAWDAVAGRLTPGQVISTLGGATPPENFPGEIEVSADGRFVYASNRGHNSIAQFSVGEQGRRLSFVATAPCGGVWPRHFVTDPAGRWVYVSNQRSGTVNWLPRDPASGKLGPSAGSVSAGNVNVVSFR